MNLIAHKAFVSDPEQASASCVLAGRPAKPTSSLAASLRRRCSRPSPLRMRSYCDLWCVDRHPFPARKPEPCASCPYLRAGSRGAPSAARGRTWHAAPKSRAAPGTVLAGQPGHGARHWPHAGAQRLVRHGVPCGGQRGLGCQPGRLELRGTPPQGLTLILTLTPNPKP